MKTVQEWFYDNEESETMRYHGEAICQRLQAYADYVLQEKIRKLKSYRPGFALMNGVDAGNKAIEILNQKS